MVQSKKQKSCLYLTHEQCGKQTYLINKTDSSSFATEGYDFVYIEDALRKQIVLSGTPKGTPSCLKIDPTQEVHRKAFQKAVRGEVICYDWSAYCEKSNCLFQSTLIPLRNNEGKISSVLGLVKNITNLTHADVPGDFLKGVNRRTFPQMLLKAREKERRELSAALHDEIGSMAVILTSLLSMVKDSVQSKKQSQALEDIASLDEQIKNSIERIKSIVVSMRPPNLDTVGLEASLRDMVENAGRYGNLEYSFAFEKEDDVQVSDEVRIVLYRVVQESLNNILKHAEATRVSVKLHRSKKDITLSIRDNGKGFVTARQRSIEHIGLLSMRDSIGYVGGKFTIMSEPGKGTSIEVICPKIAHGEKQK